MKNGIPRASKVVSLLLLASFGFLPVAHGMPTEAEPRYAVVPIGAIGGDPNVPPYVGRGAAGAYAFGTIPTSSCTLWRWSPTTGKQLHQVNGIEACYNTIGMNQLGDIVYGDGPDRVTIWGAEGGLSVLLRNSSADFYPTVFPVSINNAGVVLTSTEDFDNNDTNPTLFRRFGTISAEGQGAITNFVDRADKNSYVLGLTDDGYVSSQQFTEGEGFSAGAYLGAHGLPAPLFKGASLPGELLAECLPQTISQDKIVLIQCFRSNHSYLFDAERGGTTRIAGDLKQAHRNNRGDLLTLDTNGIVQLRSASGEVRTLSNPTEVAGWRIVETVGLTDDGTPIVYATRTANPGFYTVALRETTCAGVADINFDGVVNVRDLSLLLGRFGQTEEGRGVSADLNNDGRVDTADLTKFLSRFGQPVPGCGRAAAASATPDTKVRS